MLEVVECLEESIIATILNNASFGDKKNMNLPVRKGEGGLRRPESALYSSPLFVHYLYLRAQRACLVFTIRVRSLIYRL
jgi:hypothetical protein